MRQWISTIGPLLAMLALAACSGTDALNLNQGSLSDPMGPQAEAGAASTDAANAPGDQQAAAAAIADPRFYFASAVGTSAEALSPLQDALNKRARERGVAIETEADANLVVNGYFSTVAEERQTLVIYVWDISDKSGNRLHRIQGQERVGGAGQGWEAVDSETVATIGRRTVDELADWLSRGRS